MKTNIPIWSYKVETFHIESNFTEYLISTEQLKDIFVDFKHLSHLLELHLEARHEEVLYK